MDLPAPVSKAVVLVPQTRVPKGLSLISLGNLTETMTMGRHVICAPAL